ncbi:hypothetical protein G6F63_014681 [Rhizopus arrhizus]|nr:hypothetical protein G6F63_014681 [Rhizopus arrhizus]
MLWSGIVEHGPITFDLKNKCGVTGPWPTVADFNGGRDVIGTGPYTLKSYVKGTAIELARNDGYWGAQPAWPAVKLVPVPAAISLPPSLMRMPPLMSSAPLAPTRVIVRRGQHATGGGQLAGAHIDALRGGGAVAQVQGPAGWRW